MNREHVLKLVQLITDPRLPSNLVTLLQNDDEVRKAFAFILRRIALSDETTASTRSFKKRRQGYAIGKRSQRRIKREGGQ